MIIGSESLPDQLNLGPLGRALEELAQTPREVASWGPVEVAGVIGVGVGGANNAIGVGRARTGPATSQEVPFDPEDIKRDLSELGEGGAGAFAYGGFFHTHPSNSPFSREDVAGLIYSRTGAGEVYVIEERGGGVTVAVRPTDYGLPEELLPKGAPEEFNTGQLAHVIEVLTSGRGAVYAGDHLTDDLSRVLPDPTGLSARFMRGLNARSEQ